MLIYQCCILGAGAPWTDAPPDEGDWKNTHRGFVVGVIKAVGKDCLKYIDTPDDILVYCCENNINVVISSKRNRKIQRHHGKYIYRHRQLVENVFLHLKRWRGIATRYAKYASSFVAAIHIRYLAF